jgi:hypothetical protein
MAVKSKHGAGGDYSHDWMAEVRPSRILLAVYRPARSFNEWRSRHRREAARRRLRHLKKARWSSPRGLPGARFRRNPTRLRLVRSPPGAGAKRPRPLPRRRRRLPSLRRQSCRRGHSGSVRGEFFFAEPGPALTCVCDAANPMMAPTPRHGGGPTSAMAAAPSRGGLFGACGTSQLCDASKP